MPPKTKTKIDSTVLAALVIAALVLAGSLVYVYVFHSQRPYWLSLNRPGPCAVVNQRYCGGGQMLSYPNNQEYLGLSLAKGSYIFAPFDGTFTYSGTAEGNPKLSLNGSVTQAPQGGVNGMVLYFIAEFQPLVAEGAQVRKGEPVAAIEGGVIDQVSGSNLLLNFQGVSPAGPQFPDSSILPKYFKVSQ